MDSSMAEELVCSICLSLFQEPQMLSCGHNFCLSCLDGCFLGGQKKGRCPECRSSISREGITCNRVLANLAEKYRKLQPNQEPQPATSSAVGICKEHNEPLKLCCKQDLVNICLSCRDLPQHRGHNFLPAKSAEKYNETSHDDILSQISKEFEVFHQILNEKEQELKKIVEEKKTENLQETKDAEDSLKEEVASQSQMNTKIKTAFEIAEYFAFFKDFKQLIERVKECQIWKTKDDVAREDEKSDREEVLRTEEQFGEEDNLDDVRDDLWDWDEDLERVIGEVNADAVDGQASEDESGTGELEIEVENHGGIEVSERGQDGVWRNILREGQNSWRWRSSFQSTFQREFRWGRGGELRLGINRRGWRLGANQRRQGGWRLGSLQRRGGGGGGGGGGGY